MPRRRRGRKPELPIFEIPIPIDLSHKVGKNSKAYAMGQVCTIITWEENTGWTMIVRTLDKSRMPTWEEVRSAYKACLPDKPQSPMMAVVLDPERIDQTFKDHIIAIEIFRKKEPKKRTVTDPRGNVIGIEVSK